MSNKSMWANAQERDRMSKRVVYQHHDNGVTLKVYYLPPPGVIFDDTQNLYVSVTPDEGDEIGLPVRAAGFLDSLDYRVSDETRRKCMVLWLKKIKDSFAGEIEELGRAISNLT